MKRGQVELQPLGKRFGRWDLDRVGFFHAPSLEPFDKYEGIPVKFREGIEKGRQMLADPPSAFLENKFIRIFDGEALNEPWRFERLQRDKVKFRGHILPPSPSKKHSTPGDYFGCFEKITYFSPEVKSGKRNVAREPPNMMTKPNPRGGPGYADVCFSPFPSHSHEPYHVKKEKTKKPVGRFLSASAPMDHFPPNPYKDLSPGPTYVRPAEAASKTRATGPIYIPFPKKSGGCHAGGFNQFPTYSSDLYVKDKKEEQKEHLIFALGAPSFRTKYTTSIINHVTKTSCNATNYATYKERVYPLHR